MSPFNTQLNKIKGEIQTKLIEVYDKYTYINSSIFVIYVPLLEQDT